MACKGKCKAFRSSKRSSNTRYCRVCCTFVVYEGVWCPCCNHRVRVRSRGTQTDRERNIQRI